MAERWQQWMPHDIDAWQGSANVQALSDLAYRAAHNLILDMWKQSDCALPLDDKELAKRSRVASRWSDCRDEVLEYFDRNEEGKLTHRVTFQKWNQAREVYEKRQAAAQKTNSTRSPQPKRDGHRKPSVTLPSRNADTGTQTGTRTEQVKQEEPFTPTAKELSSMVTKRLQVETPLKSPKLFLILQPVALSELESGVPHGAVFDAMAGAWDEYQVAKPKLEFHWGAEKFFGEGNWKNKAGWPWRADAKHEGNRNRVSPAAQRGRDTRDNIASAFADVFETVSGDHDGADASAVPESRASERDAGDVPRGVGADRAEVRPADVSGRTIEGHR